MNAFFQVDTCRRRTDSTVEWHRVIESWGLSGWRLDHRCFELCTTTRSTWGAALHHLAEFSDSEFEGLSASVTYVDIQFAKFDKFELFSDTVCFCQIMHLLSICRIFLTDQGWRIDLMLSWRKRLWRINFSMFRWFEAFARCLKPSATRSGGEDS